MSIHVGRRALLCIAILGVLVSCSDDSTASFPKGLYYQAGSTADAGTMEFKDDMTFVLTSDGAEVSSGKYSTDGSRINFESDSYCKSVDPKAEEASYTWKWDGISLTFKVNGTDACAARIVALQPGLKKA
jgi:hypothetical protein